MARIVTCGFEENTLTAGVEVDTLTNVPTIDSTVFRGGLYSLKCAPANSTQAAQLRMFASNQSAQVFIRAYFKFTTLSANNPQIIRVLNAANAQQAAALMVGSTGKLRLVNAAGTQIGSDSAALTTGHWYRIELMVDGTTNPGSAALRYVDCGTDGADPGDGGVVIVASGANSAQAAIILASFGAISSNSSFVLNVDDIAINDSTGGTQNSYPSAGKVIHLHPNAAGDSNGFLTQVGGTVGSANNYTRVNEVPPDDATSYNGAALLNAEDLFRCGASGIGPKDTVNVVSAGIRTADITGADATAALKVELIKVSGGTKSQSAAFSPNSTTWASNAGTPALAQASVYRLVTYLNPDGAAWTQATLDTLQVGYANTAINVRVVAVTNVWVSVDYNPLVAFTPALTGAGSLTATVVPYQRVSPSLVGVGSLSATLTPYQRISPSFVGAGSLSATLVAYQRLSASLSGAGSLSAALVPYQRIAALLAGTGSIAVTVVPYQEISPSLAGVGSLSASLTAYQRITAALAGAGSLSAALIPYQRLLVALSGEGSLSATLAAYQRIAVALAGHGALAAELDAYQRIVASLEGNGSLSATIAAYQRITAALSGAGALAAELKLLLELAASLGGIGALEVALSIVPAPSRGGVGGSGFPPGWIPGQLLSQQTRKEEEEEEELALLLLLDDVL